MLYLVAVPEMLASAATDLARIGSTISEAKAAAVAPTTGVMAAAGDEVSAAIASLFSSHARDFQALSTQTAAFHQQFVQLMTGGAAQYASTEAANLSSLQGLLSANVTQNLPNLGYGNIGSANIGFFNTGILNIGIGNTGNANVGIGNLSPNLDVPNPVTITAFGGLGLFNNGIDNAGGWNTGVANVGFGNTGDHNTGFLPSGSPSAVTAYSLFGGGNIGSYNQGFFNTGTGNIGIGNTGSNLYGIGLTGTNQLGIGPLSIPNPFPLSIPNPFPVSIPNPF